MDKKPVLIVVYNYRYPANVNKVERIYSGRFSNIYHLKTFIFSTDEFPSDLASRVIPVFGNALDWHNFFAQAYDRYHQKSDSVSHYIFTADDLMLNPQIDETNYQEHLKLKSDSFFLPKIISISIP